MNPSPVTTIFPVMYSWTRLDRPLILASRSPRRREILGRLGFAFEVREPQVVDEAGYIRPADIAASLQELAEAKARSVSRLFPASLVLGTDTVVTTGPAVLGKPLDREDARRMLRLLADRPHTVCTGVCLVCEQDGFRHSLTARTAVAFRRISDADLEAYLDTADWADKAGAYGIQEGAMVFVDSITGCFYNVMGLPVAETIRLFETYTACKGTAHA